MPEEKFLILKRNLEIFFDEVQKHIEKYEVTDNFAHILESFEHLLSLRDKLRNQTFQIGVIALVKSGKSTLINAILGNEFLPSGNAPETARIVRVKHNPELPNGRLVDGSKVPCEGANAIQYYLRDLNVNFRKTFAYVPEDELVLEAPLHAFKDEAFKTQKFDILDTPGPNEAGAEALRTKVERLLHDVDVIIYLLDYTKLKTEEEKSLFARLSDTRTELIKQYESRLFFVVNKIDMQNRTGLKPNETASYVVDILKKQIPNLQITQDRVILISAENALLSRLIDTDRASPAAIKDFIKKVFGELAEDEISPEEFKPKAPELLKRSKFQDFENKILTFIFKNRGYILLQSIIGDIGRRVAKIHNISATAFTTAKRDVQDIETQLQCLRGDLQQIQEHHSQVKSVAEGIKVKTAKYIKEELERFNDHVKSMVIQAFTATIDNAHAKSGSFLFGLFEKLTAFFGAGPSCSESDVRKQVMEINKTIGQYLFTEFQGFRLRLDHDLYQKLNELFTNFAQVLQPVSEKIEKVVGERLNVNLQPSQIEIPIPTLDTFHNDSEANINEVIEKKKRVENRYKTEQEWVAGGFYERGHYEDRTVIVPVETLECDIKKSVLLEKWDKRIVEMTNSTTQMALLVIDKEVKKLTEEAIRTVEKYKEAYIKTVEKEAEKAKTDQESRNKRLLSLKANLDAADSIKAQHHRFQKYLEEIGND